MANFEKMEEEFQKEHGTNALYNKQDYAKKMHEKELAEMSKAKKGAWKESIVGHQWDFAQYCRDYQAKVDAHYRAKGEISPTEKARMEKEAKVNEPA